jgi:hypothetical protein
MKQALFVVSGVAIGLLMALVAVASNGRVLPQADAQAGPNGGSGAGSSTILGTGGSTQNQNDLCWILTKVKPVRGPERTVLCMYKAEGQGQHFNLKDVRMIDADIRLIELESKKHEPSVPAVIKVLPQEEQEALKPPR